MCACVFHVPLPLTLYIYPPPHKQYCVASTSLTLSPLSKTSCCPSVPNAALLCQVMLLQLPGLGKSGEESFLLLPTNLLLHTSPPVLPLLPFLIQEVGGAAAVEATRQAEAVLRRSQEDISRFMLISLTRGKT